ncbi:hypothetical protein O1Q96_04505 [Streptomyces sp. Qhu-G9]|uniref:hypothetical protein n=1 Tax=Streptomyces sp. Qhu-G9 TaxID=3452799 RepID=UPI0022ABE52E|nr:hypothetical protein [Streptomyces aurantiacus]WAU79077.1 hypothetical protein O1Q96_04505 [Streptomyces aurantiacus]
MADVDPVPGDPDQLVALGRKLRKTADELGRQIRNLKAISKVDSWDSDAGKEFRKKAEGSQGKLEAAYKRYDAAADAIGSDIHEVSGSYQDQLHAPSTNYASDLHRAQNIADSALKEAREADERKSSTRKSLDSLSGKDGKEERERLEGKMDAASGDIEAAREKIEAAKRIRDEAAKKAREAIDDIISHDSLKDGFWDKFLDDVNNWTAKIATVCGIAAMLVGWIPVIGQALAGLLGTIAMTASLIGLVCTVIQFARGDADWMDLGVAALGFLAAGVGKAFSKYAGKFLARTLPRLQRAAGRPGARAAGTIAKRDRQKLNRLAAQQSKLTGREKLRAFGEPFKDHLLSPSGIKSSWSNLKTMGRPQSWRDMRQTFGAQGGFKSFTFLDSGVAAEINSAKIASKGLPEISAINRISGKANVISLTGSLITVGGLAADPVINPLLPD